MNKNAKSESAQADDTKKEKKVNDKTKELESYQSSEISKVKEDMELVSLLIQAPHYAKLGKEGVFAIMHTARALGVDVNQALNGGMYYVKGKVEMTARMMNSLIRAKKHMISKDKTSDNTICILHGKRSDNGDEWTESFSIDEARIAGLIKGDYSPWKTFPRDMLFARALSRLARQLFPDVIGNCYVEGELSSDNHIVVEDVVEVKASEKQLTIEQQRELVQLLDKLNDSYYENMILERNKVSNLSELTSEQATKVIYFLKQQINLKNGGAK